ncbi:hypothetical protein FOCC_FOCC016413 [Frankliniella occidentalis]|nr:hypothetical protein FOCC_FOCC016413 [Frankliniella occidentalis]
MGPYSLPVPSVTPLRRALACFGVGPAADLTTSGTALASFPGCCCCWVGSAVVVVGWNFVVDLAVVAGHDCTGATGFPTGSATTYQHGKTVADTSDGAGIRPEVTTVTTGIIPTATEAATAPSTAPTPATASSTTTAISLRGVRATGPRGRRGWFISTRQDGTALDRTVKGCHE